MTDHVQLDRDITRLTEVLWSAVTTLGGAAARELCRRLGESATELRAGQLAGGRRAFAEEIGTLTDTELEQVARAYGLWCHLRNVAEERQRLRVLRARGDRAPDGLAAEVLAFHATEDARARRPTPIDEVENSLEVFRRSLLDVTPRLYRTIEDRLAKRFGSPWRLPSFFRWGTWVGGDRDGNPNVTAAVTRGAFARQRATVINRYLDDVAALGRSLSVSALRARGDLAELEASLERDRERLPEVAARARPRTANEPWREKLWYMQARLRATLQHFDEGYIDAEVYHDELELLERALRAAGLGAVADQELRDALRRVDVFGFHLASLDVRQHSGVHDKVVAELLARGGRGGYLEQDEAGRRRMLGEVLAHPITPERDWDGVSAEGQEALETLEVIGRARRELGPRACERYVISFTREVSDLLEVVFLARAAGLAPGELRPVPLLEQLEDLERAKQIAGDMLAQPTLRAELGGSHLRTASGGAARLGGAEPCDLEIMVGYSDSGKQVGYVAAQVALRRAQVELAGVAQREGVALTLFHGRGGALGRGGGPESDAIRAQPPGTVGGRIRVTEQGETVTARYAQPDIAERDLELTLAAVLQTTCDRGARDAVDAPDTEPALHRAAEAARAAYLRLTSDEDRLAAYTVAATPIQDVAHLPLGSRPASRAPKITLESLRAIPWVFSWTQSRHGIPGWFGVGTAIEQLASDLGVDGVRALSEKSRFFRALIRNCELSLVRSDIDVAREYARLADPDTATLFDVIAAEHARTVSALTTTLGITEPLASRPYLAASVARRNPLLDVLSHIQIEALRRRRGGAADQDTLGRAVFTTIGGIAAGLQTAG